MEDRDETQNRTPKSLQGLDIPDADANRAEKNRKRTRHVRFFRVILPILGVIVLFSIFIMQDRNEFGDIRPIEEVAPRKMGENELLSPRFEAMDQNNQPYILTAERAFQSPDDMDMITLENPTADMKMTNGENVSLRSNDGLYNQDNQILDLSGDVTLNHDEGYSLRTSTLKLNVLNRTAQTDDSVSAEGPDSHIEASGLDADANASVYIFKGPAKLTLDNKDSPDD